VSDTDPVAFDPALPLLILKVGRYPLHHGGVGAIRSLGRAGVPVYAVTEDRFTPAALSRYLSRPIVARTTGQESDEQLLEIFTGVGKQLDRPALALPTDDEAAVFVAEHADELSPWFVLPGVPATLPRRLASKRGLHALGTELGVPTPEAAFPTSRADVEAFAATARFPVVAKNVEPWGRLQQPAVPNSTLVQTPEDLLELAARWRGDPAVMLQEYVPGDVAEDWIFHAYCNAQSEAVVAFTGVKYRSWPPRAGVTSYARIVSNDALTRLSADLCRKLGYRGIVDLDWRFDRRDQQYKLLDFNPRVGAQFRLFETTAGIDVVRAMHLDLSGREITSGTPIMGRGFYVEYLDAPAQVASGLFGSNAAKPVLHAPGPSEPAWFATDDPLPLLMAGVRSAAPLAQRIQQLARAGARRAQTVTRRRRERTAASTRRDANSVPYTKRSSGPNVAAAVSPTKYSPGTEDSNPALSMGDAPVSRMPFLTAGLRKLSASRETW